MWVLYFETTGKKGTFKLLQIENVSCKEMEMFDESENVLLCDEGKSWNYFLGFFCKQKYFLFEKKFHAKRSLKDE